MLEENVVLLENTLGNRDQKVYELEEEIKAMEEAETVPFSSASCNKCGNLAKTETNLADNKSTKDSDENLPST